jgi:Pyruvate/2-oxoacid:ferredoxin oxidoreductase delta subunit
MRPVDPPPPTYAFAFRRQPESGNAINGLGQAHRSRARIVFHAGRGEELAWKPLDDLFSLVTPWSVVRHAVLVAWHLRRAEGKVARRRREVTDPAAMSAEIKALARQYGAALVGVTHLTDADLFEGAAPPYRHAICLGLPMDRGEMRHAPQVRAAEEVMRAYRAVARLAVRLAARIRAMGWPASAYANPNSIDLLHIPLAIRAGLGELGKHGSLISRELGSNFRLVTVLTDLPLAPDAPVDHGVQDVCLRCRRCVDDCPPRAIFETRQLVRGQLKWYVDFDKCVPYFAKTHGCAICIEVCPWSEPGQGEAISRRVLELRRRHAAP